MSEMLRFAGKATGLFVLFSVFTRNPFWALSPAKDTRRRAKTVWLGDILLTEPFESLKTEI